MNDKEIFNQVFEQFQNKYFGLEMKGTFVYYMDECVFNTDGFNLLYNLTRLVKTLENELN